MLAIRAASDEPVTEEEIARLNTRHRINFLLIVAAMLVLLLGGIGYDFSTGTKDRGERARDAQVLDAAGSRPAPPPRR